MQVTSYSVCETGLVRSVNQDAIYEKAGKDWGIFVVADGMGGHFEGERASRIAVSTIREWIETKEQQIEQIEKMQQETLTAEIREVISTANKRIKDQSPKGELCGCTLIVLLILKGRYICASMGDSRAYVFRKLFFKSSMQQITRDEIFGGDGPDRNKLVNALGIRDNARITISSNQVKNGTVFLLCSDGIYKFCSDEKMADILKTRRRQLQIAIEEIVAEVKANGARDNYSCILIEI